MSFTQAAGSSRSARSARRGSVLGAAMVLAATLVTVPSLDPEPAEAATVVRPPASIDATGARDVTAEMQTFLTKAPNHATISFPPGAKYRAEGTLAIRRKNDIVVEGNGATFFATQITDVRSKPQWVLENNSNILFSNMTIRGTHPNGGQDDDAHVATREAQHGLLVQGGERIEVRNLNISDVYGDFIYVGRSPYPVAGHPENVWIHDNKMRRNGRQGVSVTDATNVIIERNDISDTRRATFDFEPLPGWTVENLWLRNNLVGPGRLMFVAGHGSGDLSNLHIENNTLKGHSMGIDLLAPDGTRRSNVWISGNTSDAADANPRGALMRFVRYDNVDVRNNSQVIQTGRLMSTVGVYNSCNVTSVDNDLGPEMVGEIIVLEDSYDCSKAPVVVAPPSSGPAKFSGQTLAIDVGGPSNEMWGIQGCPSTSACGGYIVGGTATRVFSSPLVGSSGPDLVARTMLQGNPRFAIPIRSGTYDVKLWFVEPTFWRLSERRFYFDLELNHIAAAFDSYPGGAAKNTLLQVTYRITVGDGALDINFNNGAAPAVISLIAITRA